MSWADSATIGSGVVPRLVGWGRRATRGGMGEAMIWLVGLGAMATMDPEGVHVFSLCPLDAVGLSFCPGCGLGHAVAYLARGAVVESMYAHPLGIPAVLLIATHVGRLVRQALQLDAHLSSS